jgi:DNA replication protein DnaC
MYAETKKIYYEKNKKQIHEKQKEWRETNIYKIHQKDSKYSRQYYQDHKLEIRAKQKQIYLKKKFGLNTQEPTFTIRHGSFSPFS